MESADLATTNHARLPRNQGIGRGALSKNKAWVGGGTRSLGSTPAPVEGRWERGGHRGGRGRGGMVNGHGAMVDLSHDDDVVSDADGHATDGEQSHDGRVKTWEELVKAREAERVNAIKEGKMDDPSKPKRLDEAITMVGTCQDMCPEFERYRRERENNLDKWECLLGPDGKPSKKVDHRRAVKIYERGQGDKIVPSDLRPPPVLKRTLNYLFNELIPRGGFSDTQAFVRDRSRAVRNDFTILQETGPIAMECHERCARYHILSLHLLYDVPNFDRAMEIQQLMNSLLSLREFYADQRGRHQSPNELEMRIYHRLGLIRDQQDRNDQTPQHVLVDPAFQLISRFRSEVQAASSPITKTSKMVVSPQAMNTFAELAGVLRARGNIVMIYLVACFLENIFGRETIEDIESIRGDMTVQQIIDGVSPVPPQLEAQLQEVEEVMDDDFVSVGDEEMQEDGEVDDVNPIEVANDTSSAPLSSPMKSQASAWLSDNFGSAPTPPNPATSVFGRLAVSSSGSVFGSSSGSVFGNFSQAASSSPFGNTSNADGSLFGSTSSTNSIFGKPATATSTSSAFGNSASTNGFGMQPNGSMAQGASTSQQASIFTSPRAAEQLPTSHNLTDQPLLFDSGPVASSPESFVKVPAPSRSIFSTPLNPTAPSFVPPSQTTTPPAPLAQGSLFSSPINGKPHGKAAESKSGPSTLFSNGGISPSPGSSSRITAPVPTATKVQQPPLFIDTRGPSISKPPSRKGAEVDSPLGPPPLRRAPPISLPGTPIANLPPVPATPDSPVPLLKFPFGTNAPTPPGQLSNLFTSSPIAARGPVLSPTARPSIDRRPSTSKTVEKFAASPFPGRRSTTELENDAVEFSQRGVLVQEYFGRWRKKIQDLMVWKEACRRSEAYRQQVHNTPSRALSASPAVKRRRFTAEASASLDSSISRRRVRRKLPEPVQARTDEQLVERFKENKKEHERRWAKGSFVETIRRRVSVRASATDPRTSASWRVWLCMNPDHDNTAIWLEQKFDVPASGDWESQTVFAINPLQASSSQSFPGLVIFECVPLGDTTDDLEKKYRILDDCSRLRDLIDSMPSDRPFMPSLMMINWTDAAENPISSEFANMANDLKQKGVIQDFTTFNITSLEADLDTEFANVLESLELDSVGRLVEWLSLEELYGRFTSSWQHTVSMWLETCGSGEELDWLLYGRVVRSFLKALDALAVEVMSLWEPSHLPPPPLSEPDIANMRDPDSAYDVLQNWLIAERAQNDFVTNTLSSLRFRDAFLPNAFFEVACNAMLWALSELSATARETRSIPKTLMSNAITRYKHTLEKSSSALQKVAKTLPRSRRRHSHQRNGDVDESFSQLSSPSPSSPASSYTKLFPSGSSEFTEPPSPTGSAVPSLADSNSSVVTISMLRELSKSILKTYGSKK